MHIIQLKKLNAQACFNTEHQALGFSPHNINTFCPFLDERVNNMNRCIPTIVMFQRILFEYICKTLKLIKWNMISIFCFVGEYDNKKEKVAYGGR